jgi:hypothetical protein
VPARPGGVGEQRREPLHPPVDRGVVDLDAAFGQQFLDIAVRQTVPQGTGGPPARCPWCGSGLRRVPELPDLSDM